MSELVVPELELSGVVLVVPDGGVVVPSGWVVEPSGFVVEPSGFVVPVELVLSGGIVELSVVDPLLVVSAGAVAEVSSVERVAEDCCFVQAPASSNAARPIRRTLRFINHLTKVKTETSEAESQSTFHVVVRRHFRRRYAQACGGGVSWASSVILHDNPLWRCR